MKSRQLVILVISVVVGVLLVQWLQKIPLSQFWIVLTDVRNLEGFLEVVYNRTALSIIITGIGSLLLWVFLAFRARVNTAAQAIRYQWIWWLLLLGQIALNIILFLVWNRDPAYGSSDAVPWIVAMIILDALVFFWLPTTLATPRPLQNVPTGSMFLKHLTGD